MEFLNINRKSIYTYRDYLQWPKEQRYEIIEGIPYLLAPSPSIKHQRILGELFMRFKQYFKDTCEVLCTPCDVLLPESNECIDEIKTVVQPDIYVVCDKSKLKENFCLGSPDLIVEITSPSSPSIDYVKKLNLYEKHMVKEYWIVDIKYNRISIYNLQENNEYGSPAIYDKNNPIIKSEIFENLTISLDEVFE